MYCPNCGKQNRYGRVCECGTSVRIPYELLGGTWLAEVTFKHKPHGVGQPPKPDISYFVKEADKRND